MWRMRTPEARCSLLAVWALTLLGVGLAAPAVAQETGGPGRPHSAFDFLTAWHWDFLRHGIFQVGAAAADITPPLASAGSNPAACAGAERFDGPHLLSLEEPYTDENGNGRHDEGEAFLDCPTPTASGGVLAPDGRWDGIFLGGGDCCDRQPTRVLDPIWARTVVVSSNDETVSLTSVDNEGVFKEIWDQVRAKVRADGFTQIDEMLFSSTHDESAPDTIGISGPSDQASGSNPFYVQFLVAQTARSIEEAYAVRRAATLRFGQVRPDDLVTCWSSYPFAADEQLGVMQAVDLEQRPIVTLLNYGIHAEELGFSSDEQDRLHLSSDWHHFARQALEAQYGGVALTLGGSMGSVEMPQVYPTRRNLTPVGLHRSEGKGGCRTIYATDDTLVPYGYESSTRARGERIAQWAERALRMGRTSLSNTVDVRRKAFFLPLDNILFAIGTVIGVIPGKDAYRNGQKLARGPDGSLTLPPDSFQTEVVWLRLGDAEFVSAPGELFPYTFTRDFGGPEDQAVPDGRSPPPWIFARLTQPFRFMSGIGEDMVGYIFPRTNAVGVPTPRGVPDDTDRFGCGHSDDGEASALNAGDLVAEQLVSILPPPLDPIRLGRYIGRDGLLHRDPLGEGGGRCAPPGDVYHPAAGGPAVGVWVLPPGVTRFEPGVGEKIRVGRRGWRWMDLRGRAEAAPSTQTRGVIGPLGQRIWVDVFPDASS
jgi:hypothetical protein